MNLLFYIFLFILISYLVIKYGQNKTNLDNTGFKVYKNVLSQDEINKIKLDIENNKIITIKQYLINHPKLKALIKNKDYVFQDYIWIIKNSSVHTCHRDNNGSFFNSGQKHPSYTLLIYLEDMEKCLGIIPGSHQDIKKHAINLTNQVQDIICKKGDAIIFDSNLIHVGTLNENNQDYLRIQMKISHHDDLKVLDYYQNYNKILNKKNNLPYFIKNIQRNLSCAFPIVSDLTQDENIKSARGSDEGVKIGLPQKLYSFFYYGNSNFFDLPNNIK